MHSKLEKKISSKPRVKYFILNSFKKHKFFKLNLKLSLLLCKI
jgi:hypothetical protein